MILFQLRKNGNQVLHESVTGLASSVTPLSRSELLFNSANTDPLPATSSPSIPVALGATMGSMSSTATTGYMVAGNVLIYEVQIYDSPMIEADRIKQWNLAAQKWR